jgi:hypothetical protein
VPGLTRRRTPRAKRSSSLGPLPRRASAPRFASKP